MRSWFNRQRRPAAAAKEPPPPVEFVTQTLEPLGGKMLRPRDWFYSENHGAARRMWAMSREDPRGGRYVTGVSVQLLSDREAVTGQTAERFIRGYAEHLKSRASRVVENFDEVETGPFRRIGVGVEEGENRLRYSLYWLAGGGDLAVVVTAGTRATLWDVYEPIFDVMGDFDLIGAAPAADIPNDD